MAVFSCKVFFVMENFANMLKEKTLTADLYAQNALQVFPSRCRNRER